MTNARNSASDDRVALRLTDYHARKASAEHYLDSNAVEGALALRSREDSSDVLTFARDVLTRESDAIRSLVVRLDERFCRAIEIVLACDSLVVTGMGKAGLIGRKLSATFSSTGTPSHFLHPSEAFHGDLGAIRPNDALLALSYSGQTEELKRLAPVVRSRGISVISIVSSGRSALGRASNVALELGEIEEADQLRLAPSASAAAMLALGDALALATSRQR